MIMIVSADARTNARAMERPTLVPPPGIRTTLPTWLNSGLEGDIAGYALGWMVFVTFVSAIDLSAISTNAGSISRD